MTQLSMSPLYEEDGAATPGDDMVGLNATSVHSNRSNPNNNDNNNDNDTTTNPPSESLSGPRRTQSTENQPGAFSVQGRAAGNTPAWRRRISNFGGLNAHGNRQRSRRRQQQHQQRRSRQRNSRPSNAAAAAAIDDDQSHIPPEMRAPRPSRFSMMFRASRPSANSGVGVGDSSNNNDGASRSSRSTRFSMFSARLFGGDAVVQPQEQAELPVHEDMDEGTYQKGLIAVICGAILVIAVVVGVVLGVMGGDSGLPSPKGPSPEEETEPPVTAPEPERIGFLRQRLSYLSGDEDSNVLLDPSTPQYQALAWLAQRDQVPIDETYVKRLEARYALATLYYATNGISWTNQLRFLSDFHECEWSPDPVRPFRRGVSCDSERQVVSLHIYDNNLVGSIPIELRGLSSLQYLTISGNTMDDERASLEATRSLSNIGFLSNLISLDLSNNLLDATVPADFAKMSNLEFLHLQQNKFKFTIPEDFGLLSNLKELDLSDNRLVGAVESALETLPRLEVLDLQTNSLLISNELRFPTSLTSLNIRGNSIATPQLTSDIGRLSNLKTLNLVGTNLFGTLPTEIGAMTALQSLIMGNNIGMSGPFPWSVMSRETLVDLNLVQCAFTGQLPENIGDFTALRALGLIRNEFRGPIPESLGNLSSLEAMSIKDNNLSGTIPSTVGEMTSLFQLDVANNNLTGMVPEEISNMIALRVVDISGNNITSGSIDFICSLSGSRGIIDCDSGVECTCCGCDP